MKSITVDTTHLTATNVITATVTFAAEGGTAVVYNAGPPVVTGVHTIMDPPDTITIVMEEKGEDGTFGTTSGTPPTTTNIVRSTVPSTGVGAVYTVFIDPAVDATADGEYRISVRDVFTDADAADGSNAAKAVFIVDTMAPMISSVVVESGPVTGITADFTILVELGEAVSADGVKVTFTDKDGEVTKVAKAGTAVGSRGTRAGYKNYSIPITLATDLPAAFEGDVTISVTGTDPAGNEGAATTLVVGLKVSSTGPPPTGDAPVSVAVPAKSYVIVARTATLPDALPKSALPPNTAEGSTATFIKAWPEMPNLEDLFFRGGSLLLTTLKATELDRDGDENATPAVAAADQTAKEAAKLRDVLITEIMAARNNAKVGEGGYKTHQWIELYNNLPVPVTVKLSQKSLRPAPTAAATEVKLDLVSNVVNPGWDFTGLGDDGFDNSSDVESPAVPVLEPFVSFYRSNRGADGHIKGHWTTSTDTYFANHKGTPGALERSGSIAVGATVPTYNVVINEIGNYSNDAYDWIELRNVNSGDGNLKKWQLWEITGDKAKSTILNFPDNDDHKIGAVGSVLLIVATDPYSDPNHPLAAGINITKGNGRVEKDRSEVSLLCGWH